MTVKEKGGKWFVVKSDGSLGKRGYSSAENAQAAQDKGKALAGMAPSDANSGSENAPGFEGGDW